MAFQDYYLLHNFKGIGHLGMSFKVFEEITRMAVKEVDGALLSVPTNFLFPAATPMVCTIKKGELKINVNIKVKYGHTVPVVANEVQAKIEEMIYDMTEIHPAAVHVHVDDIK